jgi:uncharacterized membrane protein YciS (DUF1049 family)
MARGGDTGDHVAMDADVLITIVFAGFVALAAVAAGLVLLRSRAQIRAAERRAEERPAAPSH